MRRRPTVVGGLLALALLGPAVATVERPSPPAPPPAATARLDSYRLDDPIDVAGPTLATSSVIRASRPTGGDEGVTVRRPVGGAGNRVSH